MFSHTVNLPVLNSMTTYEVCVDVQSVHYLQCLKKVSGQLHAPAALFLGQELQYILDMRLAYHI